MARVLIVDDQVEALEYVLPAFEAHGTVELKHPNDVRDDDLESASLLLVDYELTHWNDRDILPSVSTQPLNGVALGSVYRAFVKERYDRPIAIALYSARLSELSKIPSETRPHVLANLTSLEWVFSKLSEDDAFAGDATDSLAARCTLLAEAVESLPSAWPEASAVVRGQVEDLLSLPTGVGVEDALWSSIARCNPPMYELSTASHGMWFVDWLLHDIIPYSTFLIDHSGLAAKLKLTPEGLDQLLMGDSTLAIRLSEYRYKGVLSGFDGPRWWDAAVSAAIAEFRGPAGEGHLGQGIAQDVGLDSFFTGDSPVIAYDATLRKLPDLIDLTAAVPIYPDLWPVFAARAYAPVSLAEDPAIQALASRASTFAIVRTDVDH